MLEKQSMAKNLTMEKKLLYTALFLTLVTLIIIHAPISLTYSLNGLNLWFTKMIPTLFPFMVLSGIMVRLNLTENFSALLYPILRPLFYADKNMSYVILIGFLCGFPMGAKTICDLLERDMITETEARLLLAFCNNIGPIYFCSFVLLLLKRRLVWPYLFGMYGIPFLYGAILSRTVYKMQKKPYVSSNIPKNISVSLLAQIDDAVLSSIHNISMLGGYMILFNLFNIIPHVLSNYMKWGNSLTSLCAPLFEITGGLNMLGSTRPLLSLLFLSFGGLSCIAQTYSIIKNTKLSIKEYIIHKLVLTILTGGYYLGWFMLFPATFLL